MTITKSGELASFYTVNKTPIKHLRVYFSPKQAGEGDPSPENVREIEGWDGVEITKCGKNLIPLEATRRYRINGSGEIILNNNDMITDYIPIISGATYIFSTPSIFANNERNAVYDKNKNFINVLETKSIVDPMSYTMPNNACYVRLTLRQADFEKSQFEFGSTATPYESYHGQTYNLDWSNDIGTVYGGYVDLITGEVCETWKLITGNGLTTITMPTSTSSPWDHIFTIGLWNNTTGTWDKAKGVSNIISDVAITGDSHTNQSVFGISNNAGMYLRDDSISTQEEFLEKYGDKHIAYEIATPIFYSLTPTELQTFLGRNNIWSNADRVEIEYDLAESNDILYRRRNVLEQYPHIVTPAANGLINFNTDIKAPLKQCKVYFSPIQEGEGDPSPENVRPISGWTGVDITRYGKNLFDGVLRVGRDTTGNGTLDGSNTWRTSNIIKVKPNTYYQVSYNNGSEWQPYFNLYDDSMNRIAVRTANSKILTTEDTQYITLQITRSTFETTVQTTLLEEGQTITSYEPYSGITLPINWSNSAGTVYGGYVDLVKGELIQTCYNMIVDENTIINRSEDKHGVYRIVYNLPYTGADKNALMCNKFGLRIRNSAMYNYPIKGLIALGDYNTITTSLQIGAPDEEITTQEKWLNWLTVNGPIQVIYELAEPIHYSLTPTQLKTLRGINNIWSNSNGNIELSYWTH